MFSLTSVLNNIKEDTDDRHYMDSCEQYILGYINNIENFIKDYGYHNPFGYISNINNIKEIESNILEFFKRNNNRLDYLEILGTLKALPNKKVYVCCYEAYGDEVFCIELKNNNIFFFDFSNSSEDIKIKDINYLYNELKY